jgi:hypothetical protein
MVGSDISSCGVGEFCLCLDWDSPCTEGLQGKKLVVARSDGSLSRLFGSTFLERPN